MNLSQNGQTAFQEGILSSAPGDLSPLIMHYWSYTGLLMAADSSEWCYWTVNKNINIFKSIAISWYHVLPYIILIGL